MARVGGVGVAPRPQRIQRLLVGGVAVLMLEMFFEPQDEGEGEGGASGESAVEPPVEREALTDRG